MGQSAYEALYKVVMNINEDGHWPHGWHGLDGDRCIKRDTPTVGVAPMHSNSCWLIELLYWFKAYLF